MAGNPTVLSVDDTPGVLVIVEKLVKRLGFDFAKAGDGKKGLEQYAILKKAGTPIKLIISDVNMPVMDGMTFVKEVRKTDQSTPILFLTTVGDTGNKTAGKQAGANGWLEKPINPATFLATVKKITGA